MKKLIATLIALIAMTVTSNAMACPCETLAEPAMNAFQPALASFMEQKMGVLPGDITEVKEIESKERNSLMNGLAFNSLAIVTSPVWLPFYISEEVKAANEDHYDSAFGCPILKDVFKAKFMITYRSEKGKTCKLPIKYKAKAKFLNQFRDYTDIIKTVVKTKYAPECE